MWDNILVLRKYMPQSVWGCYVYNFLLVDGGGKFNVRRERNKANIGMKNQLETLSEGFMSIHCTTLINLNFQIS